MPYFPVHDATGKSIGFYIEDTCTWGRLVSEIAKKLDGLVPYAMYSTYRFRRLRARPEELVSAVLLDDEMTRGVEIRSAPNPREECTRASEAVREAEAALEAAKRLLEEKQKFLGTYVPVRTTVFN